MSLGKQQHLNISILKLKIANYTERGARVCVHACTCVRACVCIICTHKIKDFSACWDVWKTITPTEIEGTQQLVPLCPYCSTIDSDIVNSTDSILNNYNCFAWEVLNKYLKPDLTRCTDPLKKGSCPVLSFISKGSHPGTWTLEKLKIGFQKSKACWVKKKSQTVKRQAG